MKNIKQMVHIALFAALIALCTLISIPTTPPFTMQIFAVFLAIYALGARRAFLAILIYTAIGLLGVPVFSGFRGGAAVLFGATGGYIIGFLLMPPIYSLICRNSAKKVRSAIASAVSLIVCYTFGTVWFIKVYGLEFNIAGILTALQMCVLPFILPDCIKALLAYLVYNRIKPILKQIGGRK